MLRDLYAYGSEELHQIIEFFKLGDVRLVKVLSFRMLNADSFVWELRLTNGLYYLYAEDFIDSIKQVQDTINILTHKRAGHFIAVRKQKDFEELEAVKAATIYSEPKDYKKSMKAYVADSGFDLVLLYKIDGTNEREEL